MGISQVSFQLLLGPPSTDYGHLILDKASSWEQVVYSKPGITCAQGDFGPFAALLEYVRIAKQRNKLLSEEVFVVMDLNLCV